jgi:hypothetical protein
MRRICGAAVVAAVVWLTGPVGCGVPAPVSVAVPVPEKWVDEIITHIVQWVEEGTGIDIERGDVKIENRGVRKDASGGAHISDFGIAVTYRKTQFASTSKDIPCSAEGIPTEEGNRRIKAAVEEIKTRIRAMGSGVGVSP